MLNFLRLTKHFFVDGNTREKWLYEKVVRVFLRSHLNPEVLFPFVFLSKQSNLLLQPPQYCIKLTGIFKQIRKSTFLSILRSSIVVTNILT